MTFHRELNAAALRKINNQCTPGEKRLFFAVNIENDLIYGEMKAMWKNIHTYVLCARETNQLSHKVSLQMHHPSEKDSIKPPSIAHSLRISTVTSQFSLINGKDGDYYYYCAYTYRNAPMLYYVQNEG